MNTKIKLIIGLLTTIVATGVNLGCGYQSMPPQPLLYGRVLLGPDKTDAAAVIHFIVRGNEIFVDKNKDDIPQPEELNTSGKLEPVVDVDAEATYLLHELRLVVNPQLISEKRPQKLGITADISGRVKYQQLGAVVLNADPKTPDWVHFHGPVHMILADQDIALGPGSEALVRVWIGTNAVGSALELGAKNETGESLASKQSHELEQLLKMNETQRFANLVPFGKEMLPEVKVEIPTDGSPFIETLLLDDFC